MELLPGIRLKAFLEHHDNQKGSYFAKSSKNFDFSRKFSIIFEIFFTFSS